MPLLICIDYWSIRQWIPSRCVANSAVSTTYYQLLQVVLYIKSLTLKIDVWCTTDIMIVQTHIKCDVTVHKSDFLNQSLRAGHQKVTDLAKMIQACSHSCRYRTCVYARRRRVPYSFSNSCRGDAARYKSAVRPRAGTETSVMKLVCFSWAGLSVWEFRGDAALESSCSTTGRTRVLLVCGWRGASADRMETNEFVCVVQRSSPLSKLDQLVSVGRTCAEGGVCERQTFTLARACVFISNASVRRPFSGPFWTHKPLDPHWALLKSDWSGKNAQARPLKRKRSLSSGYSRPIGERLWAGLMRWRAFELLRVSGSVRASVSLVWELRINAGRFHHCFTCIWAMTDV